MRTPAAIGAALLAVVLTGCGGAPPAVPDTVVASSTPGGVSATDTAWTQLMVALDERALAVLDLVPKRTTTPRLADLTATASARLRTELGALRLLLARSSAPATNPHEGHDMPGMATAETLARMARLTGPEFDQLVLTSLRAYYDQCLLLADSEQTAGSDASTKELARTIEGDRRRQLDDLAGLPDSG